MYTTSGLREVLTWFYPLLSQKYYSRIHRLTDTMIGKNQPYAQVKRLNTLKFYLDNNDVWFVYWTVKESDGN